MTYTLTHIGGLFQIGFESFESNITNLNALYNLTSIDGSLTILWHPLLTSLYGLENIDAGSIDNLTIRSNTVLSSCDVQSICDYLVSPNGTVEFYDNATGCNSPEEVQDSCEAHAGIIAGISLANRLLIYPNPAHASITIELPTQPSKNTTLTISSTNGQQLITQRIRKPHTEIDIRHLPVGIYIIKVWNDKDVMVRKVVKQ